MILLFYITLSLILVPFIGYLILYLLSKKEVGSKTHGVNQYENVSIIIPCYNEEKYIKNKIEEILNHCSSLYKRNYEIIIISDGSTDSTNNIIDGFDANSEIQIVKLEQRQGKANALNIGVALSQFDLLIFSDVRQRISTGNFNDLLSHFNDSEIGIVSSVLRHSKTSFLRHFINQIKQIESKSGSTVGVYGALYAMRKNQYNPLPEKVILDDLLISIRVLNQGKRVKMDSDIMIEDVEIDVFYNKTRVVRMMSGLYQLSTDYFDILKKLPFKYLFFLYCQKYYKLLLPFLVMILPIFAWLGRGIDSWYFLGTVFIYILLFCLFFRSMKFIVKLCKYYFITLTFRRVKQSVLWDK